MPGGALRGRLVDLPDGGHVSGVPAFFRAEGRAPRPRWQGNMKMVLEDLFALSYVYMYFCTSTLYSSTLVGFLCQGYVSQTNGTCTPKRRCAFSIPGPFRGLALTLQSVVRLVS